MFDYFHINEELLTIGGERKWIRPFQKPVNARWDNVAGVASILSGASGDIVSLMALEKILKRRY